MNDWDYQRSMLDASVDCIKIIETDGSVRHMNRSGCIALGVPVGETRFGMKWLDLLPREVRARGRVALARARSGKNARFAGKSISPDGRQRHWDNILTPQKNHAGETVTILCVSRDVTLQREAERRLRIASDIDDLTGLSNRRSFKAGLQKMFLKARARDESIGLMLLDLDHFKQVNDTLGHAAGDHLLRTFSARIRKAMPAGALAARLGGDEFALATPGGRDEALRLAETVLARTQSPVRHAGRSVKWGASIGCAVYPDDAGDLPSLMKCADIALYRLKSEGRGGVRAYRGPRLDSVALGLRTPSAEAASVEAGTDAGRRPDPLPAQAHPPAGAKAVPARPASPRGRGRAGSGRRRAGSP